ncbi:interleukin-18 receptor 1-like isoform X1 [Simochromis diagramma]|uniref:interleukin-18 receptor 1-like isoform X1 n=1 Tax=Simochromis diagramma TaxID=43689 RepID=UPI001A7ED1B6|nr:interleukin-18 receptor 1-like isoform X1 [Simochromis diagramma]
MFPGTLKKSFKSARFLSDILKHFVQAALELVHVIILINDTLKLFHFAGVCPQSTKEIRVKEGEIVAEFFKECDHNETLWRSFTKQGMHLHNNTPAAEHRQMGVMVQQGILVILSASEKNEGNYSCFLKNSSRRSWISLKVYTAQSRDSEQMNQISKECYTEEHCKLYCPEKNFPFNTLNITRSGITWHKEGESSPKDGYFSSVKKEDSGIYTCTRSYLYDGQIYNMTSTVKLDVQPNKITKKAVIISPENKQVFEVDLGSTVVIDCKAVMMSGTDDLFWLSGSSFVDTDTSLPVFYNDTRVISTEEIRMRTSLIFRKVSEDDLSKNYTCKLQSAYQTSFVTITLKQKASRSYMSLGVCFVIIVVVTFVTVVTYVKFKIHITLFLIDTLKWSGSISDGKCYDAFLMCYKCDTAGGLNPSDKRWLESVLEEKFGYSLCLYDRDVLPGKAIADAVLDCIEQSRAVVLVPVSPDPDPESGLLSAIHEALVERQTRLVFITTETSMASKSDSFPEALQLLSKAGKCITWKGISSMPTSSSFWKQLRYCLLAPQQAPTVKLLPQTIQDITS